MAITKTHENPFGVNRLLLGDRKYYSNFLNDQEGLVVTIFNSVNGTLWIKNNPINHLMANEMIDIFKKMGHQVIALTGMWEEEK